MAANDFLDVIGVLASLWLVWTLAAIAWAIWIWILTYRALRSLARMDGRLVEITTAINGLATGTGMRGASGQVAAPSGGVPPRSPQEALAQIQNLQAQVTAANFRAGEYAKRLDAMADLQASHPQSGSPGRGGAWSKGAKIISWGAGFWLIASGTLFLFGLVQFAFVVLIGGGILLIIGGVVVYSIDIYRESVIRGIRGR